MIIIVGCGAQHTLRSASRAARVWKTRLERIAEQGGCKRRYDAEDPCRCSCHGLVATFRGCNTVGFLSMLSRQFNSSDYPTRLSPRKPFDRFTPCVAVPSTGVCDACITQSPCCWSVWPSVAAVATVASPTSCASPDIITSTAVRA